MNILGKCALCPRKCEVNREKAVGFCGAGSKIKAGKAMLHFGEEPCISGKNGSGAIFFSGCSLRCCFCQNMQISRYCYGKEISEDELCEVILKLQSDGAENINLVSAVHFLPQISRVLSIVKPKLKIPVVYNSGGYENADILEEYGQNIDVFLPDFKYYDNCLAKKYSGVSDYFENASASVIKMSKMVGKPQFNKDGVMTKGLIIRHLILPSHYKDSIKIVSWLSENFSEDDFLISIMRQYTPLYGAGKFAEINRKLTTFEYQKVLDYIISKNINGFMQEKGCETTKLTPVFNLKGI